MKKPHKSDTPLNDDDIARVFEAQDVVVPDDLKHSIFEQAELQSAIDTKTAIHLESGDPASVAEAGTGTGTENRSSKVIPFRSMPGWFAVAATVVVAVAVAPVLLKSPESSLDDNRLEISAIVEADSAVTSTGAKRSAASAVSEMTKTESTQSEPASKVTTAQPPALRQSAKESSNDEVLSEIAQTSTAFSITMQSDSMPSEAAAPVSAEPSFEYRNSADKWINEIKIFIADGDRKKAEEEYLLFAKRYPERAKDFKPDFARRTITD